MPGPRRFRDRFGRTCPHRFGPYFLATFVASVPDLGARIHAARKFELEALNAVRIKDWGYSIKP
jgi:hypothetical protein